MESGGGDVDLDTREIRPPRMKDVANPGKRNTQSGRHGRDDTESLPGAHRREEQGGAKRVGRAADEARVAQAVVNIDFESLTRWLSLHQAGQPDRVAGEPRDLKQSHGGLLPETI
jgi:hypothetical protein